MARLKASELIWYKIKRAKMGWFNWYVNRGHFTLSASDSDLRRVSWRRKF